MAGADFIENQYWYFAKKNPNGYETRRLREHTGPLPRRCVYEKKLCEQVLISKGLREDGQNDGKNKNFVSPFKSVAMKSNF